jgi:AcrR family transcriptional regulator
VTERLDSHRRRQEIVDAALQTFAGRPYTDVRMDDVAEVAGVSKALLYKHFPGKRELYLEVTRIIVGKLRDLLWTTLSGLQPDDQLDAAVGTFVRFAGDNRDLFGSLFHSGLLLDPDFAAELEAVRTTIESVVLADGERTPALEVGLRGVMGFVEAATARWLGLAPETMTEDEVVALMVNVLRAGLQRMETPL